MQKIVINQQHGGFSLSQTALNWLKIHYNFTGYDRDINRNDLGLIKCIETLSSEVCSGNHAKLKIIEIPDQIRWEIEEYDGLEWVSEIHQTWS